MSREIAPSLPEGTIGHALTTRTQRILDGAEVVRVVIPDHGIDADYRVVVEPDLEQDGVYHYSLHPVRDDAGDAQ